MNSKSKSTLTLTIKRPAYGDFSISRHKGKIVLVKGVFLPGECVEAIIVKEHKDYISASVKELIESAPERTRPECEYYGNCGGCHLQHIPYDLQVQLKGDILSDCLRRIGKIDIELSYPLLPGSPWNYRLRGHYKVSGSQIGFYRGRTHEVVNISACPLMIPEVNSHYQKAGEIIRLNNMIKEFHIIQGDSAVAMVKLSSGHETPPHLEQLAVRFIEEGFSGILLINEHGEQFGYGRTYSTLELAGLSYAVSPSCFFQGNWMLNVKLVDHIKNTLSPLADKDILDLYAGSGNFSLPLAEAVRIVAIEDNTSAIEIGKQSAAMNEIGNISFIKSAAEDYITDDHFDIVVMDPPRSGLKDNVTDNILTMMPERIVYVSCNPTTLARDLKKLGKKYRIESVRLVDFFPHTYHIESLAFLRVR
ncbi:MAG: 23S rRNA (uracil(1939)-C(5))-methyltransferase RlmD [Nitrospiraceae bacterium]|nr:MAG: 23S rRNA (uracil(1939)-C(5))-methyltransferase RlmD [Nitrospiraceae bacterium]